MKRLALVEMEGSGGHTFHVLLDKFPPKNDRVASCGGTLAYMFSPSWLRSHLPPAVSPGKIT
jgi:hypothetical protein